MYIITDPDMTSWEVRNLAFLLAFAFAPSVAWHCFFRLLMCRCCCSDHLLYISMLVCIATLWHSSSWILVCTGCSCLVAVPQCTWLIQHCSLESTCLSSTFSILHVQVFEEDQEERLDVLGWNFAVHNRWFYVFILSLLCMCWPTYILLEITINICRCALKKLEILKLFENTTGQWDLMLHLQTVFIVFSD